MSDREKLVQLIDEAAEGTIYTSAGDLHVSINSDDIADHLLANGVTVQKPVKKAEDCRCYTKTNYGGACLGTREIDPCKGDGCENWKRRRNDH